MHGPSKRDPPAVMGGGFWDKHYTQASTARCQAKSKTGSRVCRAVTSRRVIAAARSATIKPADLYGQPQLPLCFSWACCCLPASFEGFITRGVLPCSC